MTDAAPPIETERLLLRAVVAEDAADIFAYASNPNVLRYTTGTPPRDLAETQRFVDGLVHKPRGCHAWAIRLKPGSRVIGVVEFGLQESATRGSVDYALAEEHWNRGIMTEAVRAVLDWAFKATPTLEEVTSGAMAANPASTRVQEKCGMRRVRLERETWEKFADPVEIAICRITREEWAAARAGA